jgi:hypothetical protein
MRRLALVCALLLLPAAAAVAAHRAPQRPITSADQAEARSMLLRAADLTADFRPETRSESENGPACAALDESDLTVTGDADSPDFTRQNAGYVTVGSSAQIYRSIADAGASWRRGTSAGALRCVADYFKRLAKADGSELRFVSVRKLAFPRVAPLTARFQVLFRATARGQSVPIYFDVVVLQQGRAQASLMFGSAGAPVPQRDRAALAGVIAQRMARALSARVVPRA